MDMGVLPDERRHPTASTVKRLNFFEMILATLYKGKWGNRVIFEVFSSRIKAQGSYGDGTGGKWKRRSNYIFY
jgi:hypothetical protein